MKEQTDIWVSIDFNHLHNFSRPGRQYFKAWKTNKTLLSNWWRPLYTQLSLFKQNIAKQSGLNHKGAVYLQNTTIRQKIHKSSCFLQMRWQMYFFSLSVLIKLYYSKLTRWVLERMYSCALYNSQQLSVNWLLEPHEARATAPSATPSFH